MREDSTLATPRRLFRWALLPLPALLAGCASEVLNPAGDVALQQRDIIFISTALMLLIIVPVLILIVIFAWRYRASNKDATYDPEFDHSTALELVIWSAPLLIIIALGALTWWSTHLLDPFRPLDRISAGRPVDPKVKPLNVQVVSLDWKWLFIYPEQGIATVNELALPVDRPVHFDITSSNMMNTFYAPTLAGMIYAMPGMRSQLHAVLNRPGQFQGMSANYSGAGFSDMRFTLKGLDQAGFDAWVAQAKAGAKPLDTAAYLALAKPSERVPVMHFTAPEADLFNRVLDRCVAPGTPCMSDQMDHGQGTPPVGNKPEGHLMKGGEDKQPVPNGFRPTAPGTPDAHGNHSMSYLNRPALPARAGNGAA